MASSAALSARNRAYVRAKNMLEGHDPKTGAKNGAYIVNDTAEARSSGKRNLRMAQSYLQSVIPINANNTQYLSPPDEYGFMSLGVGVDCTLNAARSATHVIAEVNRQMPRSMGDSFLHVSRLTAIVETDRPLLELRPEPFTDLQRRIGENIEHLIPDGATRATIWQPPSVRRRRIARKPAPPGNWPRRFPGSPAARSMRASSSGPMPTPPTPGNWPFRSSAGASSTATRGCPRRSAPPSKSTPR